MRNQISKQNILLASFISIAAFFYLSGIKANLPYIPEVDEKSFWVARAVVMADTLSLNPGFFGHPGSTMFYPMAAVYRVVYKDQVQEAFDASPSSFYLIGRAIVVGYALLTLPVIFWIGKQLFGTKVAFLGTGLFVLNTVVMYYTNIIRSDMAALFFGMLGFACFLKLVQKPNLRNQVLAGIVTGLGIASRYFMVVSGLILLAMDGYLLWRQRENRRSILWPALVGLLCIVVTFAVTTPYFFLDFHTALNDFLNESRTVHLGADGLTPLENFWFYIADVAPANMGWVQIGFLITGIYFILKSRQFSQLLFLAFGSIFLVLISLPALHWNRWMIQVLPVLNLVAAYGVISLITALVKRVDARNLLIGLGILAVAIQPAYQATIYVVRKFSPNTRILAREWIIANLQPSDRIVMEEYSAILAQTNFSAENVFSTAMKPLGAYVQEGVDYLVVSDLVYQRFLNEPSRYPQEVAFYDDLFACNCMVQEIARTNLRAGPTIRIFDLGKLR